MVRLKKHLNKEEMGSVLDDLKGRFKGKGITDEYNKFLQTKLYEFINILKKCDSSKKQPKKLMKLSDLKHTGFKPTPYKEDELDKICDPSDQNLLEGEILFTTLTQLLEVVRAEHQIGTIFSQYVNPISQLTGYSSGDGNKYVINIVDLRKDPRADSFTFSPMKLLEGGK